MTLVGISIIGSSNSLFWETFIESFQKKSGISPCILSNDQQQQRFLSDHRSRLLICEYHSSTVLRNIFNSLGSVSDITVIAIDVESGETFFQANDISHTSLVKIVQTIVISGDNSQSKIDGHTDCVVNSLDINRPDINSNCINNCANNIINSGNVDSNRINNNYEHRQKIIPLHQNETILDWLDISFHLCTLNATEAAQGKTQSSMSQWIPDVGNVHSIIGGSYKQADKETLKAILNETRQKLFTSTACERKSTQHGTNAKYSSRQQQFFETFSLNTLQQQLFFLILAADLDSRYAKSIGYFNDDLTRTSMTPALLSRLLESEQGIHSAWGICEVLFHIADECGYGLINSDGEEGLSYSHRALRIPKDIIHYFILDIQAIEKNRLFDFYSAASAKQKTSANFTDDELMALKLWSGQESQEDNNNNPIITLRDSEQHIDAFIRSCGVIGRSVVLFDLGALISANLNSIEKKLQEVARAVKLSDSILITKITQTLNNYTQDLVIKSIKQLRLLVPKLAVYSTESIVSLTGLPLWSLNLKEPTFRDIKTAWQRQLKVRQIDLQSEDISLLASTLKFNVDEILAVLDSIPVSHSIITLQDIIKAAMPYRRNVAVPMAVRRITPQFKWKDIVVSNDILSTLKTIPAQIRNASKVLDEWGYQSRMLFGQNGIAVLFSGASGTGKTMAAQIIAAELETEVFQVDLSKTMSKYIGETEKNLESIFVAAEKASAVLLFDEADALFGKRTEIKDSHDRHANVEVAYLLQRIESFSGLAILTTNLRQNLDRAFMRRLRFIVEFPIPEPLEREKIWQACFPGGLAEHTANDFKFLSRRLELSGGNIQQIAIRAAFNAAVDNSLIETSHILKATTEELQKLGMTNAEKTLQEIAPITRCVADE